MNVLQVLPELYVGGVERGTVDLAKHLIRQGHKAVVVSAGGSLVQDLEACGAIHYQLPVHRKSPFLIVRQIKPLVKIIRDEKIDIVHARSRAPAWSAFFASRITGAVFVTTCHGYYSKHPFSTVMGWGKRVIVLSNVIACHMIEDFGVPRDRIRIIPRSVDLEKFTFSHPDTRKGKVFHVGIIGRLTPLKGHLVFIRAMAKVARTNPDIRIWIVGDAPSSKDAYKEQIRLLVKRLNLEHCTEFLGNQKDIPAILAHLNLVVLATTTQEAFGRVVIEAQACGVPVVATAVGGIVDIIENGTTGLLVPAHDPSAMADAINKIAGDSRFAARLAEAAYAKVKDKYSLQSMVENTLQVYREALTQNRILVLKFSSLGDIILSTAGLAAIRRKFPRPDYRISFLVGDEYKEVLQRNPHIDELLVCDFKSRNRGLGGFLKLAKSLRKKNFDMVIDLQNNRRSHALAALSLSLRRYGYDNKKWSVLLNRKIRDLKEAIGPVAHQFRLLDLAGIGCDAPKLELYPTENDQRLVDEFLKQQWLPDHQTIVGINIGASKRWQTKIWPLRSVARLCEELNARRVMVVVTGTAEDCGRVTELTAAFPKVKLINACGRFTVNQLACLIRRCSVYISADSAPLHVAAAMGVAFIALFGPTDPRRHLPPAEKFVVLHKKFDCSPCYRCRCARPACMESISVEEVLAAVEQLMK